MADEIKSSQEATDVIINLGKTPKGPVVAIKKMAGITGVTNGQTVANGICDKADEAVNMAKEATQEVRKVAKVTDDQDKQEKAAIDQATANV